jgi:hypothetical protein
MNTFKQNVGVYFWHGSWVVDPDLDGCGYGPDEGTEGVLTGETKDGKPVGTWTVTFED